MNNFTISGFVVNNAEVHNFEKSSIARFGISYRTSVKKDDQEIKLSAILNIETWIKNDDTATLDLLQKGKLIKVEGFFKADTYTKDGKDFHVTKMTATKIELVRKTAKGGLDLLLFLCSTFIGNIKKAIFWIAFLTARY